MKTWDELTTEEKSTITHIVTTLNNSELSCEGLYDYIVKIAQENESDK